MTRHLVLLAIALGGLGCAAPATFPAGILSPLATSPDTAHVLTTTDLSKGNYRVVHTGARGQSQGFVLLLFFKIIPTSLTEAVDELYEDAGLAPGGSWALANLVVEQEGRNFLLFALPRIRVRADVVEFEPSAPNAGEGPAPTPASPAG